MSASQKRTLREAHSVIESIAQEVSVLLGTVVIDVEDTYGEVAAAPLVGLFDEELDSGGTKTSDLARQFSQALVARLLYSDDVLIDWRGAEQMESGS